MVYTLILFVHVIAALVLVGHSVIAPVIRGAIESADSVPALRSLLSLAGKASSANPFASLLLLGSGIYLGSAGWWYAGWFYVSIALWIVNSALAVAVVKKMETRLAATLSRASDSGLIPAGADYFRRSRGWTLAERVMLANDVAILFVMLNKPELVPSMALVVAANVIGVGLLCLGLLRTAPEALELEEETELAA